MFILVGVEIDGIRLRLVELIKEVSCRLVDIPVNLRRRSEELLLGRDSNCHIKSIAGEIVGCDVSFYWSLAAKVVVF